MKKYKYESYNYDFEKKYYLKLSSLLYPKDFIIKCATYDEDANTVNLTLYDGVKETTMVLDSSSLTGSYE